MGAGQAVARVTPTSGSLASPEQLAATRVSLLDRFPRISERALNNLVLDMLHKYKSKGLDPQMITAVTYDNVERVASTLSLTAPTWGNVLTLAEKGTREELKPLADRASAAQATSASAARTDAKQQTRRQPSLWERVFRRTNETKSPAELA